MAEGKSVQGTEMFSEYRNPLTTDDVAKALNVSRRTIYRLVESGELPAVKVGHRIYFPRHAMTERFCVNEKQNGYSS